MATTYAEALYEAAADGSAVAQVSADLAAFDAAVAGSEELARVLKNPEVETSRKRAVVQSLAGEANPLVARFLTLLVERGRISELADISRAFAARVAEGERQILVEAITAVPLTDDLRREIIAKVEADTGLTVSLTERIDAEVLGGLVLRVGGVVFDGSLRTRFDRLRTTLTTAPVEGAPA